jgi:hypothetical protein
LLNINNVSLIFIYKRRFTGVCSTKYTELAKKRQAAEAWAGEDEAAGRGQTAPQEGAAGGEEEVEEQA